MYFNRLDICEAWYLALSECYNGQWSPEYARLCHMESYFRPSPMLVPDSLSENGQAIYKNAIVTLTS